MYFEFINDEDNWSLMNIQRNGIPFNQKNFEDFQKLKVNHGLKEQTAPCILYNQKDLHVCVLFYIIFG